MMHLDDNQLTVRRGGRLIPIEVVTTERRIAGLLAGHCEPAAAPLIVAGVPRMLAKAVALLGWHDAWAVLDKAEFDHAALWRMRPPR